LKYASVDHRSQWLTRLVLRKPLPDF
jgi:hypothetical protein